MEQNPARDLELACSGDSRDPALLPPSQKVQGRWEKLTAPAPPASSPCTSHPGAQRLGRKTRSPSKGDAHRAKRRETHSVHQLASLRATVSPGQAEVNPAAPFQDSGDGRASSEAEREADPAVGGLGCSWGCSTHLAHVSAQIPSQQKTEQRQTHAQGPWWPSQTSLPALLHGVLFPLTATPMR